MEGNKSVLLDSNIVIYSSQPEFEFIRIWIEQKSVAISDITRIEVLGYKNLQTESKIYFKKLFSRFIRLSLVEGIILQAIHLRQQKSMSLGDSIIAATALVQNIPLLTANTKNFRHISNLKLIDLNQI